MAERPKIPLATAALTAGLVVAALLGGTSTDMGQLHRLGARQAMWGFHPHPIHLVAPLFLHYGWLHWACNLISLVVVARIIEALKGAWCVLYLFFLSGIVSILVSLHVNPQVTAIGCSGAVFGLLGAVALVGWLPPLQPERRNWTGLALLSVALSAMPKQLPIDHSAHWGGLLAGALGLLLWNAGRWVRLASLLGLFAWCCWECREPRLPLFTNF